MNKIIYIIKEIKNALKSFLIILLFSRLTTFSHKKKANNKKQCVILGNAPSLSHTLTNNKNFIKNKEIFCINNFGASKDFKVIKPKYYILADPVFWSKSSSEKHKKIIKKCFEAMKSAGWEMFLILPVAARKWNYFFELNNFNPKVTIYYVNTTEAFGSKAIRHFFYNLNLAMPTAQNVLVMAIFVSLKMGYKKIYLAGADHSWHENIEIGEDNVLYMKYSLFHGKGKSNFVPFYSDPEETKPYQMHNLFRDIARMFKSYMELEEYSKTLNSKIYNISPKSYIDAFERIKING